MRHGFAVLLLCLIGLTGLPIALPGQHKTPDTSELEATYHYVPPSASQSVEIGDFYFRRKKYPGALSRYEEAARDDPYYAAAYLGMGKAYEKMGRKREALAAYQKYLETLPSKQQADEATDAQKAIRQLERELNQAPRSNRTAQKGPTAAKR
ncbi:MAG: tetratricopeptide repeat protein [Acidobacteria bacterium]|nr:MAG: tetratricopeptide repeat protein [Acidobacteriota bacterium]